MFKFAYRNKFFEINRPRVVGLKAEISKQI